MQRVRRLTQSLTADRGVYSRVEISAIEETTASMVPQPAVAEAINVPAAVTIWRYYFYLSVEDL